MQIILHHPQFALHATIGGTLTGHETIALVVDTGDYNQAAGVISLDRGDVARILPQLQRFAAVQAPPEAVP